MLRRAAFVAWLCASALPALAEPQLVALVPAATDDARRAIALGPHGEIYAPAEAPAASAPAWIRTTRFSTVGTLTQAGRIGSDGAVVALGNGIVYRLADNGWSALRLAQRTPARLASGRHAVGAVGRQLHALDRLVAGEHAKLGSAPSTILAIGGGPRSTVVATAKGLFRATAGKLAPIRRAPPRVDALVDDRWAIAGRSAIDLAKPAAVALPGAVEAATVASDGALLAVVASGADRQLVRLDAAHKLTRSPLAWPAPASAAVGIVADRAGRIAIALADGRIALRAEPAGAWQLSPVTTAPPVAAPGAPPATSR